jgi:hypothetical protein
MITKDVTIALLFVCILSCVVFFASYKIKRNGYRKRRLEFFKREVDAEYFKLKHFLDNNKSKYDLLPRKNKLWINELIDILCQIDLIRKNLNVNNLHDCEEKMKSNPINKIGELIGFMGSMPDEKLNVSVFTSVIPDKQNKKGTVCETVNGDETILVDSRSPVSDSVFFENPEFFAGHDKETVSAKIVDSNFDFSNSPEISHWNK